MDLAAAAIRLRLSATRSRWRRSRQLIEQRLGILQDRDVEAFGESAVNRGEEITGFGAFALVAPETGEAGGDAQFPEFATLLLRHCQRSWAWG